MERKEYASPTLLLIALTEDTVRTSEVWMSETKEFVEGDLFW